MAKIKVNYSLKSDKDSINKEINGIINDNRIVYIDDNIKTTIEIKDNLYLCRESNEYKIEFIFDKNNKASGTYYLKEYNVGMDIDIETLELSINDKTIVIKYDLTVCSEHVGIFEYELKYEIL